MRIIGVHTTRSAVRNHISSEMARKMIAVYTTVYHLWFLVYLRGPLQRSHLLLHHLHHGIPYLMSTDYTENPVPERSGSMSGELRRNPMHEPTETENKKK